MNGYLIAPLPSRWARVSRLAVLVTIAAAAAAWFLASVGRFSEQAVVISVMVISFVASWLITNHRSVAHHRVTHVRVRTRTR